MRVVLPDPLIGTDEDDPWKKFSRKLVHQDQAIKELVEELKEKESELEKANKKIECLKAEVQKWKNKYHKKNKYSQEEQTNEQFYENN